MTSSTSSTKPPHLRRFNLAVWWGVTGFVALLVASMTSLYAGAVTAASVFMGICTLALGWVAQLVVAMVLALVRDAPPEELAVATGRRRKELEREKLALLKALKELEFDHEMGKVSDADFEDISANYRSRTIRVMRQLEADAAGGDYPSLVERDVAARRKKSGEAPKPEAKPVEDKPASPQTCKCGVVNDADADFCKKCGAKLDAAEAAV